MFLLISLLVSQFQIGVLYADSVVSLSETKQENIEKLEVIEEVIDTTIEKIDKKINNTEIEARLEEKEAEVEEYLQEVKQEISSENSERDIKKKVKEAQKVVVLKVVSGVTQYEDVVDNISTDVADTPDEIEQATETLQDSLETKSWDYSIIIKTKHDFQKTLKLFHTFDTGIVLETLYDIDGVNYFEVGISEDSLFRQEMFEDIEKGILPETYLWIEIVLPEVFGIEQDTDLSGEDLSQTWGIEQYRTYEYFSNLDLEENTPVTVWVVDTGIDYRHPDLSDRVIDGYDFVNDDADALDDQWHGTHVAGTIGASINAGGIIGVNPYVQMSPLKICNARGFCPSYAVLRALDYATEHNIDILNMSLWGRANPRWHAICEGIQAYRQSGGIVVSAAGNSNIDTSQFVPGWCEDVISVSAIDETGNKASFSNYGNAVDIAAPGVGVYSTYPIDKGNYRKLSGTSMSTPHVVGLVSLLRSDDPSRNQDQILELLREHPLSVNSRVPIAQGVNTATLFDSLQDTIQIANDTPVEQDQIQDETEVEDTPTEYSEDREPEELPTQEDFSAEGVFGDDAGEEEDVASSESISLSDEVIQIDTIPESEPWTSYIPEEVGTGVSLEIRHIDFGEGSDSLEINSLSSEIEQIDIPEIQEDQKDSSFEQKPELQLFDENGQFLEDTTFINNFDAIERAWIEVGDDFDIENLPHVQQAENIEINSTSESQEYVQPIQESFIDGAEKLIEINSQGDNQEPFTPLKGDPSELLFSSPVITDENGEEIPLESFQAIEILEKDFIPTPEVLIDGAKPGIQINSDEEPTLIEAEIFDDNSDTLDPVFTDIVASPVPEPITTDPELTEQQRLELENILKELENREEGVSINSTSGGFSAEWEQTRYYIKIPNGTTHTVALPEFRDYRLGIRYFWGTWVVQDSGNPSEFQIWPAAKDMTIYAMVHRTTWDLKQLVLETIPGPPVPTEVEVFQWQSYQRYIYGIKDGTVDISDASHAEVELLYNNNLRITGVSPWFSEVKVYLSGKHEYTYHVTVKPIPEPQVYDVSVVEWQSLNVYLPERGSYNYSRNTEGSWVVALYNYTSSGYVTLRGRVTWKRTFQIRDSNNLLLYIINVDIVPDSYVIEEYTVYENHSIAIDPPYSGYYHSVYSPTPGIAGMSSYANRFGVFGITPGTADLHIVHDFDGYIKTLRVTVLPEPEPQVIQYDFTVGTLYKVYLPKDISEYDVYESGDDIYLQSYQGGNTMSFDVRDIGTMTLSVREKWQPFITYLIHLHSYVPEVDYTLHHTEHLRAGYHSESNYNSYNTAIARHTHRSWKGYIVWEGVGKTTIYVDGYKWRDHKWNVEVLPKPDPIEIECETNIMQRCSYNIAYDSYYYSQTHSGMAEIRARDGLIEIRGNRSGEITVYLKHPTGDYVTHVLKITVLPNPVDIYSCTTPVWVPCQTNWYHGDSYNYTTSNASIVGFSIDRFYQNDILQERLKITGNSQWKADVYVYRHGEHVATFEVTVTPPVSPLRLWWYDSDIYEWDTETIDILDGWGEYKKITSSYEGSIIDVDVDTSWEHTGTIEVTWLKPGSTELRVEDKYGQFRTLYIDIIPSFLRLAKSSLSFDDIHPDTYQYIGISHSYKESGIDTVIHSNPGIVEALQVTYRYPDGTTEPAIKVAPKRAGTTTLTFTDHNGDTANVEVRVSGQGNSIEEDGDITGNLIKNGQFNGYGEKTTAWGWWLWSKDNGWRTYNKNQSTAAIKDGRLHLNNPGWASYVEVRNTDRGYFGIADTSLKIKPNTTYRIEYDYETKYISGTQQHGFKLWILTSDTSGNKAESFDTIPYVNTTKPLTHVTHEFTTPSNAHYANISPVIYGHWGDKNLNMQAWVDNLSLVEVLGKPDTPVPNGVRYIRDSINGASNSTSNVWNEIQAIERNTGINRAKNIIPTTDITNVSWTLSRLTDGNTGNNWTGRYGWSGLSYMQLDLWAIYDISQIKVWHYNDGRIYKDTKTEVSPDGINWTTLHDAAIHGTYNEPRDGSGRSYGVRSEEVDGSIGVGWEFKEIHYEEKKSDEWLDSIGFQLDGDYEEVGILYLDNGEAYQQILQKDSSWLYILSCDDTCPEKSVPYVVIDGKYKKADADYISFWKETYSVANVEDSWVEINTVIKKWNKFYQQWSPSFWTKNSIGYQYLNGMEIAIIDFFNNDTNNYSWNPGTATKIVKLASWERSLQSSIDAVPDIKVLWDDINRGIDNGTHSYSDESRRYIKWYLWMSAVIEEDRWRELDQTRVKKYIQELHFERKLIAKTILDALYGNEHYNNKHRDFQQQVETINIRVNARFIKRPSLFALFPSETNIISYSKQNVEILKQNGVITEDEYIILSKVEDEYKKLYREWIQAQILKDKTDWALAWSAQALEDYFISTLSIFNPAEFIQIISWLADFHPSDIIDEFAELYDIYKHRDEILWSLEPYDEAYYIAYIKTTFALVVVPVKLDKVNKVKKKKAVANPCPLPASVSNSIGVQSWCKRDVGGELKQIKKSQFGLAKSITKKRKTGTKWTVTGNEKKVPYDQSDPTWPNAIIRENESPWVLADYWYNVDRLPDGNVPWQKYPDYKINGEIFDNIAPQWDTKPRNMADRLYKEKFLTWQSPWNWVINLWDSTRNIDEVLDQFKTWETPLLKKLLIITKDKDVYELIFE